MGFVSQIIVRIRVAIICSGDTAAVVVDRMAPLDSFRVLHQLQGLSVLVLYTRSQAFDYSVGIIPG
jgi:hypothetical protein